jgi:hypothetical protein
MHEIDISRERNLGAVLTCIQLVTHREFSELGR